MTKPLPSKSLESKLEFSATASGAKRLPDIDLSNNRKKTRCNFKFYSRILPLGKTSQKIYIHWNFQPKFDFYLFALSFISPVGVLIISRIGLFRCLVSSKVFAFLITTNALLVFCFICRIITRGTNSFMKSDSSKF